MRSWFLWRFYSHSNKIKTFLIELEIRKVQLKVTTYSKKRVKRIKLCRDYYFKWRGLQWLFKFVSNHVCSRTKVVLNINDENDGSLSFANGHSKAVSAISSAKDEGVHVLELLSGTSLWAAKHLFEKQIENLIHRKLMKIVRNVLHN